MPIKHAFQSTRNDSDDGGSVQPSEWNADHELDGILALIDTVAPTPNMVMTLNGAAQFQLLPYASFAPSFSPTFTGVPLAPTADPAVNNAQIATTQFVKTALANLVASAPTTLDTLNEIATALGNDPNFSATITASLGNRLRVDAAQGLTSGQQAQGRANLGLATIASSGAYSDLTGTPTLGTAAAKNVGTAAGNVVQLDATTGKLPAVDGSLLTNVVSSQTILQGHLSGLTLSTAGGSSSFGIAAGQAADSAASAYMSLATAYTKTTAAWAAGSGNGALDTGAIAASASYHVFLIKNITSGISDVLVSLSATAPALPSGYTLSRRIGSMKTDASSHWVAFIQVGDDFMWTTVVQDFTVTNPGASAGVLAAINVPTGVNFKANMRYWLVWGGTPTFAMISSPLVSDQAPAFGAAAPMPDFASGNLSGGMNVSKNGVMTDTSGRIRYRLTASDASTTFALVTLGWTDTRGK